MSHDQLREEILSKLRSAGCAGLRPSKLGIAGTARRDALDSLLSAGEVVRFACGKGKVYFLAAFAPSLESAYRTLDEALARQPGILLSTAECGRLCRKHEKVFLNDAVRYLINDRRLLKLKRGRASYLMHVEALRSMLDGDALTGPEAIARAYSEIARSSGQSWVSVRRLSETSALPVAEVIAVLEEMAQKGGAAFSRGEPTLLPEEERSAHVVIGGDAFYLVRLLAPASDALDPA